MSTNPTTSTGNPQAKITIDVVVDRATTKEALRSILHAILFHRLFGTVKPQTFEVLDVTLPAVKDPEIERRVDEKVDAFWRAIEGDSHKRGQIILTFAEKRPKKQWFYVAEEEVPWEEWVINAEVRQPKLEDDQIALHRALAKKLITVLHTILKHTSSENGRAVVPLIRDAKDISPFPILMTAKVGGIEV